jgi:hypothetical protein
MPPHLLSRRHTCPGAIQVVTMQSRMKDCEYTKLKIRAPVPCMSPCTMEISERQRVHLHTLEITFRTEEARFNNLVLLEANYCDRER